ncbi:zinc finger protein PLAG1 [Cololabis saira]|uniref:zinc finger protein PLAG1 n=1 Tax=Cololabis saira TaxID=129043 RepID=UPI002AD5A123|nr:zinc finger protein PLAG1 [Cololabis saira]
MATGAQGYQGHDPGAQGYQGHQVPDKPQGYQGHDPGAQGYQGHQVPDKPQGYQGHDPGAQGHQGHDPGAQGYQGHQVPDKPQGHQGHRDHVPDQVPDKPRPAPATGRRRRATDGKPRKNFPCPECQKAFNSLEKLKVHSFTHTGERPYRCSHPDCSKAFVSKYKLLRHTATHSPEKNHKCSYCEKMFHRKDHLKNHLQTHDPHKQAFACRECGKSYNTKLGFKRHLALHAANRGDLTCQVCLQPFASTAAVLEHLKAHAGKPSGGGANKEKRHRCEHCERRFYTRKDVRRHLVVHTGRKDFLCQFCAQRFGRKDHLTRHVKKSHHRRGNDEPFKVKTEPADSLEPSGGGGYDPASGGVKGELTGTSYPVSSVLFPPGPTFTSYQDQNQNLKGELESYLMELQSAAVPCSSAGLQSKPDPPVPAAPAAMLEASQDGGAAKTVDSLMDFSQLFNFLPLNGPPYGPVGVPGGPGGPQETQVQVQGTPQGGPDPPQDPSPGLSSSFMSNLRTPTTLPSFHQAFQ